MSPNEPDIEPATTDEPAPETEQLREEIAETREELGETVEALAQKADVKAQAAEKKEEIKTQATEKRGRDQGEGHRQGEPGADQGRAVAAGSAGEGAAVDPSRGRRRSGAAAHRPAAPAGELIHGEASLQAARNPLRRARRAARRHDLQADLEARLRRGRRAEGHRERVRMERSASRCGPAGRDLRARQGIRRPRRSRGIPEAHGHLARATDPEAASDGASDPQSASEVARTEAGLTPRTAGPPGGNGRAPESPTDLGGKSWGGVLKRTRQGIQGGQPHRLGRRAHLLRHPRRSSPPSSRSSRSSGCLGSSATQALMDNVSTVAPGPAKDIVTGAIENLQKDKGAAGVLFIAGLAGGAVVGVGLRGGIHARVQLHLRHRGGAADLEDAADPRRHHPRAAGAACRDRDLGHADRRTGKAGRQRHRPRGHRRACVGHRQVAGPALHRELHVRLPLLGGARTSSSPSSAGSARAASWRW